MTPKAYEQRLNRARLGRIKALKTNTLPKETIFQIFKLRLEGYSYNKIGYILKIHPVTALRYCKDGGIKC